MSEHVKPPLRMKALQVGLYLLVQQVDVKLSTGNHGYPELGAELIVQLAQRAHEELPVRCNRLVARLCWRVRPQSCAKVMLGCCKAYRMWSGSAA